MRRPVARLRRAILGRKHRELRHLLQRQGTLQPRPPGRYAEGRGRKDGARPRIFGEMARRKTNPQGHRRSEEDCKHCFRVM